MSPRVLVVEHEAGCPPALLGEWLAGAGCALDVWRPWAGEEQPGLSPYDALVVLGGEMGAYDDERHHWLGPVKAMVVDAVASGVAVLGICLGHQLVAVALGGAVERNPRGQSVGLQGVGWREPAATDPLVGALARGRAARGVHWNSDVVTALPPGAVVLAELDGHPQVVRFAQRAWGLQLHPEADAEVVRAWADGDRADHLERGIDTDAALAGIRDAEPELAATWRPLAEAFARVALEAPCSPR